MRAKIQAVRGMNDILPDETPFWRLVEDTARDILTGYGYQECRVPIIERTELFIRSIGEVTDIVEKEMYTFVDRNGESLTLRPEATASMVRAAVQQGLLGQAQRLWCTGPMFRYERPQRGRTRQFHQLDVEAFGLPGPDIDAELNLILARLFAKLGIDKLRLEINSLGTREVQAEYRSELIHYFEGHTDELDEDSRRRLATNPLRILDSKNPAMQDLIDAAPRLIDHLDGDSCRHFDGFQEILTRCSVSYEVNPRLVRGLDYYTRTVFEWVTDELGAQGTVCGGGRYDGLVEEVGGKATPAIGFAMGIERIVEILRQREVEPAPSQPQVYLAAVGPAACIAAYSVGEMLRNALPGLRLLVDAGEGGFKKKIKAADRSAAIIAIILGEDEVASDKLTIKYLRESRDQETLERGFVINRLREDFSV